MRLIFTSPARKAGGWSIQIRQNAAGGWTPDSFCLLNPLHKCFELILVAVSHKYVCYANLIEKKPDLYINNNAGVGLLNPPLWGGSESQLWCAQPPELAGVEAPLPERQPLYWPQTGHVNKLVCWGWYGGGQRPLVCLGFWSLSQSLVSVSGLGFWYRFLVSVSGHPQGK
jgi:hypothetical protein